MPLTTVLFVDDEPALRLTFPALLEPHGFTVEVAGTVSEALEKIRTQNFDILISDLNIGEPGDGFTLVSAMKRTQPACRNFIMTGYPAFEAALEAIRSQVDAFFVKPTDVDALLASIGGAAPPAHAARAPKLHIADLLRQNVNLIGTRVLGHLRVDRVKRDLPVDALDRFPDVAVLVLGLADRLDSATPDRPSEMGFKAAFEHGRARYAEGYSLLILLEDAHAIHQAICDTVEENLMSLDLSRLISDLKNLADVIEGLLKGAILGFFAQELQTGRNLLGTFWKLIREDIEEREGREDTPEEEAA